MGAAKASYGHSMLRYAVSSRLITPTQAIIIDRSVYLIQQNLLA